jgi:exo-beta-1,3-glucanase (GH17 family)
MKTASRMKATAPMETAATTMETAAATMETAAATMETAAATMETAAATTMEAAATTTTMEAAAPATARLGYVCERQPHDGACEDPSERQSDQLAVASSQHIVLHLDYGGWEGSAAPEAS